MSQSPRDGTEPGWKDYAFDLLSEAVREGFVQPAKVLECLFYAAEPDLLDAIRALAALDGERRSLVSDYARALLDPQGSPVRNLGTAVH
jgi:hypothetical protein